MCLFSKIRRFLGSTKRNESGLLTVEAVLVFPILVWTITSTFTFFDGFRQSAANLKAAYTVGDLISRETDSITNTYIDSMQDLMNKMVNNGSDVNLRVSVIRYDEVDKRHYVNFSALRGYDEAWSDDNIGNMKDSLPPMSDQDALIIVETSNKYEPTFGGNWVVGTWVSEDHTFTNFVFTSPRFTNKISCEGLGPNCD